MTRRPDRSSLHRGFANFLAARLTEERSSAAHRGSGTRAVAMLDELLWELEQGESLDRMSLDLLVLAYARHDDFDPAWNRWLAA